MDPTPPGGVVVGEGAKYRVHHIDFGGDRETLAFAVAQISLGVG